MKKSLFGVNSRFNEDTVCNGLSEGCVLVVDSKCVSCCSRNDSNPVHLR